MIIVKTISLLLILVLFSLNLVFAQERPQGKIQGKVIDMRTNEPLAGVNIQVLDSQRGAATDLDGLFFIDKLAPGTYRLSVTYIGNIEEKFTDIVVTNNKPAVINVKLSELLVVKNSRTKFILT
jgi:hypothetical protein